MQPQVELGEGYAAGKDAEARAQVEEMCRRLLANTVVENFRVEIG